MIEGLFSIFIGFVAFVIFMPFVLMGLSLIFGLLAAVCDIVGGDR